MTKEVSLLRRDLRLETIVRRISGIPIEEWICLNEQIEDEKIIAFITSNKNITIGVMKLICYYSYPSYPGDGMDLTGIEKYRLRIHKNGVYSTPFWEKKGVFEGEEVRELYDSLETKFRMRRKTSF
ncbi:MAG: hypothetical protein V1740_03425 [Candidatus Woesearchaeota archaeon]